MKIFTAGWSLQKPDQNYFKKFLRFNDIKIDGIVYPKKIPEDIEGIPVLGFDTAQAAVQPDDLVIDMAANGELQKELEAFFAAKGVKLISIAAFIDGLLAEDRAGMRLPVAGVQAGDIRHLKSAPAPDPFDRHFHDAESYDVASKLDGIFRHSEWQRLVEFDRDDTPQNVLLHVLLDLNTRGLLKHLSVIDSPRIFLDAILQLKLYDPKAAFTVGVSDEAIAALGGRAEFYRRSLADCIVPFTDAEASAGGKTILLAGSAEPIVAAGARASLLSAVCFMPRSVLDYLAVKTALGERPYRILLRQPDTAAHNLLAAILTPALFGT